MPSVRRKNPIVSKRRVDDEEGEELGADALPEDDDSLSEGTISDEDAVEASSHAGSCSPISRKTDLSTSTITGGENQNRSVEAGVRGSNDTDLMLHGIKSSVEEGSNDAISYDDLQNPNAGPSTAVKASSQPPLVVGSTAQMDQLAAETPTERRRREHDDYKQKRDADPAFVPNRGAFFMHDHRHAGPAANGFRPFGRGRGRGRGIGGPFAPMQWVMNVHILMFLLTRSSNLPQTELTDSPWKHDMHEVVQQPQTLGPRQFAMHNNTYGSSISQAPRGPPVNRTLSSTKVLGNVKVRILLPSMKEAIHTAPIAMKQYTHLPDHRPPLRRDKPVRISLPNNPPRYIYPAQERSFIFIPRAMRPNQQGFGGRSRGRSAFGSISGYSRRTSVFGGSIYGGTSYTPSIAMSRRSSLAFEVPRESIISPSGSIMSRPPLPIDGQRPVVRLPPSMQAVESEAQTGNNLQSVPVSEDPSVDMDSQTGNYPLPQKPTFRENRPSSIPMQHPRPQKSVSVADIESPATLSFNPPQQQQQPFSQQLPAQINGNGYAHDSNPHSRTASYPSHHAGTPLSNIPERAIHAQPFQPNPYQQQAYYPQQYTMVTAQPGYYYPQTYVPQQGMTGQSPAFYPGQQMGYQQPTSVPQEVTSQQEGPTGIVSQVVNGMTFYYDAAQIPAVAAVPSYQQAQPYPMQQFGGVVGMGGMMTPSPDGFYVPQQQPQGAVYYPQ